MKQESAGAMRRKAVMAEREKALLEQKVGNLHSVGCHCQEDTYIHDAHKY